MANESIHAIVYPNEEILQSAEEIMFSCDDPIWVLIPTQTCLQELKNLILMNFGDLGRKEITRLLYRMLVVVANSFVYQKMQIKTDTNVSMMFSYHRGIASVFAIELCVQASSPNPSFSLYVNWPVHPPPPEVPHFEDHVEAFTMHLPEMDDPQTGGVNSESGDDEEFIPETQPPIVEPDLGVAHTAAPLRRVSKKQPTISQ
ncbi:hypothetical protein PIB30_067810 [Stylosanthes scabra]|uniref:Uncharacterized protein n=1 Tax=Stylosanthes scabra TaxID=79078 RepID=A0ABU6QM85_9FABA|nr:hypothetical protein [Stylosanthes scabra]